MTLSIRARLTFYYSFVVVTVLVVGASVVAVAQERRAFERLDGELQRLMLTLEGVMRNEFGEGLDLQSAADEASIEVVAPDRTLVLARPDGRLLAMWGQPIPSDWRPPADGTALQTILIGSTRRRLFSHPVAHDGHHYVAAVIAPLAGLEAEHSEILRALAVGVAAALAAAALGGWVVGRQTLRPLADMARQATSISERDLAARLRSPHSEDELGRFAAAFNGLLDRLAAALHAQRQFMADASHELRTPVSVVRTTAQVTLARDIRTAADYRESLTIVADQTSRLARLVDAMFLLSRAEAQGIPLRCEPLYLDEMLANCVRALRVFAKEKDVDVLASGDDAVTFVGDDMLLRQMIGNLLENAIRHARRGGKVGVTVERKADAVTILVTDDGQGIPAEQQSRIFDRFVRLDPDSQGAGLGLPIARWIAEAHGGRLALASSNPGGSAFLVTLPLS